MRKLRNNEKFAHSPYGQQSGKQRVIELENVMRFVSRIMALEKREEFGESETNILHRLQEGISEIMAGYVPETLSEIQKVWQSIADKEKDWLIIRVSSGDSFIAERPGPPMRGDGMALATHRQRVKRLKYSQRTFIFRTIFYATMGSMELKTWSKRGR